jgi:hypothetical protein
MEHPTDCGQNHCGACCGGSCTDCGGALLLSWEELELLRRFAALPFLPVARRWDSEEPVCLEDRPAQGMAQAIIGLYQKRLIRLDYDIPLTNFDYAAYEGYPVRGSMALTAAGQQVVEQLEIQGIEE